VLGHLVQQLLAAVGRQVLELGFEVVEVAEDEASVSVVMGCLLAAAGGRPRR
jgi:hypothetical protein